MGPGAVAMPPAAADVMWAWLRVSALLKGFGLEVAIGAADMLLSRLKVKKFCLFFNCLALRFSLFNQLPRGNGVRL